MQEKKGEAFLSPEIAKLTEKLQKDPSSKLFFPLAEEYIKCSMLEEAIMVLTDGLKTHPGFHAARVSLGKVYLQKGRVAEAKAEFEKVVAQSPDNLMAQKKLAFIYRDEGSIEKAKRICGIILLTNAKDVEMKNLLAELEKLEAKAQAQPAPPPPTVEPSPAKPEEAVESAKPAAEAAASAVVQDFAMSYQERILAGEEPLHPLPEPGAIPFEEKPEEKPLDAASGLGIAGRPQSSAVPIQDREKADIQVSKEAEPEDKKDTDQEPEERKIPVIELDLDQASEVNEEDIFAELLGSAPPKSKGPSIQNQAPIEAVAPVVPSQEGQAPGLEGDLATMTLAELYVKQGHYEQGIEVYRRILEHDPDNEEVRQKLEDTMALANLLTKRPRESRPTPSPPTAQETPPPPTSDQPVSSAPEQQRQAKIQRLQAWLEQLRRSQNP